VKDITLLITGGSGLVGHALQKLQSNAVYISSKDFDLTRKDDVKKMYEKHKPDKVIHLAAKVGGIKENINHPAEFIHQNVLINSYVIHYAYKYNVKKLLATLSNCAYPNVAKRYPMTEDMLHDDLPAPTNLAYGYSKRILDIYIRGYRKQYGCNFISVIPCSIYGPYDRFEEEKGHFLAALIKKIYFANINNEKTIKLFGTGKPLRQYIYSEDLVKILLLLLEKYDEEDPVNVAPKENLSIKEIAETAIKATGSKLTLNFDKSSPDGQYRKDLSNNKLFNIIGNFEFTPLSKGIGKTYEWFKENG
jgi:GDP-L-fucose synthase